MLCHPDTLLPLAPKYCLHCLIRSEVLHVCRILGINRRRKDSRWLVPADFSLSGKPTASWSLAAWKPSRELIEKNNSRKIIANLLSLFGANDLGELSGDVEGHVEEGLGGCMLAWTHTIVWLLEMRRHRWQCRLFTFHLSSPCPPSWVLADVSLGHFVRL